MKNIAILGSTGSIGSQTLDIVRQNPDLRVPATDLLQMIMNQVETVRTGWIRESIFIHSEQTKHFAWNTAGITQIAERDLAVKKFLIMISTQSCRDVLEIVGNAFPAVFDRSLPKINYDS